MLSDAAFADSGVKLILWDGSFARSRQKGLQEMVREAETLLLDSVGSIEQWRSYCRLGVDKKSG